MSRTQWFVIVLSTWLAVNALLTVAFSLSGSRRRRRGGVPDGAGQQLSGGARAGLP